jgi:glycosyltransferase 2 family protein
VTVGALGAVLLAAGWVLARQRPLPSAEVSVFRWFNAAPDWLATALWPAMQFGAFAAPVVIAVILLVVTGRNRPAFDVAVSGMLAWSLTKLVKAQVRRPRPAGLLADVHVRDGLGGWGFASGHTAMAFAMATAIAPWLPRWGQVSVFAAALLVGAARMVFGAHLPIDVVGGAGLGILCGLAAQLALELLRPRSVGDGPDAVTATDPGATPEPRG